MRHKSKHQCHHDLADAEEKSGKIACGPSKIFQSHMVIPPEYQKRADSCQNTQDRIHPYHQRCKDHKHRDKNISHCDLRRISGKFCHSPVCPCLGKCDHTDPGKTSGHHKAQAHDTDPIIISKELIPCSQPEDKIYAGCDNGKCTCMGILQNLQPPCAFLPGA